VTIGWVGDPNQPCPKGANPHGRSRHSGVDSCRLSRSRKRPPNEIATTTPVCPHHVQGLITRRSQVQVLPRFEPATPGSPCPAEVTTWPCPTTGDRGGSEVRIGTPFSTTRPPCGQPALARVGRSNRVVLPESCREPCRFHGSSVDSWACFHLANSSESFESVVLMPACTIRK